MTTRSWRIQASGLALVCALLAPELAFASGGNGLDDQPVVRRQMLYRGSRHELTVDLGGTLADAFTRNYMLGGAYQYFFDNWIGAGLGVSANLCGVLGDMCKTALAEDVATANPSVKDTGFSKFSLMVMPYLSVVPMSGKVGLFKQVLHYDTHILAGGVVAMTSTMGSSSELKDDTVYGPMIGIGQRVFLTDSLSVTLSLKDLILSRVENTNESGKQADAQYSNNFVLSLGVSFYFPSEVQISH